MTDSVLAMNRATSSRFDPLNVSIVGVLNLTPDSFFAGSRVNTNGSLLKTAVRMVDEGAAYLEVGGESTGPSSRDIGPDEECERILPAIRMLREALPDTPLIVDTWKSAVAKKALDAGVSWVNDVTAGRGDERLLASVRDAGAGIVLMFSKDTTPRTTIADTKYDDVLQTVGQFLTDRTSVAISAGIAREKILIDPGLGHFISADPFYSYEILTRLNELLSIGSILVSPSRKSFLSGPSKLPPEERLAATISASVLAALRGASFIRTHDVGQVKKALHSLTGLPAFD